MVKINVYILTDGKHDKQLKHLRDVFSGEIFNVEDIVTTPEIDLSETGKHSGENQIKQCLERSYRSHPGRPVITIKDDSITNMSNRRLEDLMKYIERKEADYNLFYLCRWEDECQKMIDIKYIPFVDVQISRTYSPRGTQAIYFSREGRDILLGKAAMRNKKFFHSSKDFNKSLSNEIYQGNIISYCTVNNIFNYDISRAVSNSDFNKTSLCKEMKGGNGKNGNEDEPVSTNNLGYLWFILVIILAVIITFAIVRIGR